MSPRPASVRRRLLVPDAVQLSALDCGPAALHALLAGCGIRLPFDRLRERCRVGRDGTSIDTLAAVAGELGLEAEQVLVPADHLLLPGAGCLPSIVVVVQPGGATHFVTLWRSHGRRVQVMDPSCGRRWPRSHTLAAELYRHRAVVPAAHWRAWAGSPDFQAPLAARLGALGLGPRERTALLRAAADAPGWLPLAALDAAARCVAHLVASHGLRQGTAAARLLVALWEGAAAGPGGPDSPLPAGCWSVEPVPARSGRDEEVRVSGALLVRVPGRRKDPRGGSSREDPRSGAAAVPPEASSAPTASRQDAPARPRPAAFPGARRRGGEARQLHPLRLSGLMTAGLLAATCARLLETLVLAAALRLVPAFATPSSRAAALALAAALSAAVLLLELAADLSLLARGRQVETRFRLRLLAILPRLPDAYLRTRLPADLAERAHLLAALRRGPELAAAAWRAACEVLVAAAAIVWLDPALAALAAGAAAAALLLPLLLAPAAADRVRRLRAHTASLGAFYLDLLRGLAAVRAHGGGAALRRRHDQLLTGWRRALGQKSRLVVVSESVTGAVLSLAAAALVLRHVARAGPGGVGPEILLLALWAAQLAAGGRRLAETFAVELPYQRTVADRLAEPLAAPLEPAEAAPEPAPGPAAAPLRPGSVNAAGAALSFEGVSVAIEGREVLCGLDFAVPAGQHVAVVGPSGAGKSTLLATLLGWHEPARGSLLVDGRPLGARERQALRARTAWAAPAVALWDRSLLDNVTWAAAGRPGAGPHPASSASGSAAAALRAADLLDLPAALPHGLASRLGEGGGILSGGEGQRLRLARALLQPEVTLALLDEPCRGLDRDQRRELLDRARARWRGATLLCVTHSPAEAAGFDRVLVLDRGRLVEDGPPAELAAQPRSRFRALLDAERAVDSALAAPSWRRLRLSGGRLRELAPVASGPLGPPGSSRVNFAQKRGLRPVSTIFRRKPF
ncbi:MAG TPA: ATP-binding cassette domain-containing protein [Thermoanaerobaculia bacterium]|nr:ATP-binding cassette domain-containing protein [Thermoanaerobaculia bacterium]